MVIAVNTRFLLKDYLEGYGNFTFECFSRLVKKYPQHTFLYIFDREFDKAFITSDNITPVIAGPEARHPLLWQYWYNYKVPAILRKYKADVFVSPDGFCSLRTKVPQCLVLHDLAFIHYPQFIHKSHLRFYKRFTPKFLQKAKSIATVSQFSKEDILRHYKIADDKIDVVYNGISNIFKPIGQEQKEAIKTKYAEGREFFLYTGSVHPRKNLMHLLKAFSIFKKRQKSNMQLLIAGRLAWKYESFTTGLKNYKYRNEVKLLGYLPKEDLAAITASAYAMVYPSYFEGFGVPPLEAMRCEVPVIASNVASIPEICGDAAIYIDPENIEDIAEKLMLLYKDEALRSALIAKGKSQSNNFSWDKTTELLWHSIIKATN